MDSVAENEPKSALLRACRYLLAPVVRMLLRGGVTWAEFAELGKEVYVDVARRDYGLQGRPTNAARVALLTGLSRREVGRVRDVLEGETAREPAALDRLSHVLTGWHRDPEFIGANGIPAELEPGGDQASMSVLLKRYAGDMPHGAVLKELESLGLVVKEHGRFRVTARNYVRRTGDPDRIRQAGVALHDHAQTVAHNIDTDRSGAARFERMATTTSLPAEQVSAFNEFAASRSQALLEEIDDWLSAHSNHLSDSAGTQGGIRCGVGVYVIQNEVKGVNRD